nr:hypothetical protein CPGR_02906 [Mycolicibacterium malmesburyense]
MAVLPPRQGGHRRFGVSGKGNWSSPTSGFDEVLV